MAFGRVKSAFSCTFENKCFHLKSIFSKVIPKPTLKLIQNTQRLYNSVRISKTFLESRKCDQKNCQPKHSSSIVEVRCLNPQPHIVEFKKKNVTEMIKKK